MASLQPRGSMLETSCGSPHYACPEVIRVRVVRLRGLLTLLIFNSINFALIPKELFTYFERC